MAANPSNEWAAFNETQKSNGMKLLRSMPSDRLIVERITLDITVSFLRRVEKIGSHQSQIRREAAVLQGRPWSCRMSEVTSGSFRGRTDEDVDKLYYDGRVWAALRPSAQTYGCASLAFCMASTAHCALYQLAFVYTDSWPYCMWRLLTEPSETLAFTAFTFLNTPTCMLCPWSQWFLARYNSVELLLGRECRAVLVCLGMLLRFSTDHIECRHAQVRRLCLKSPTWHAELRTVSAGFVLLRHRLVERQNFRRNNLGTTKTAPQKKHGKVRFAKRGKNKGHRTGGGGLRRYLVGCFLRGRRYKSRAEKSAAFKEAHAYAKAVVEAGGAMYEEAKRVGAAATVAHKAGGQSFGDARKRRRTAEKNRRTERRIVAPAGTLATVPACRSEQLGAIVRITHPA